MNDAKVKSKKPNIIYKNVYGFQFFGFSCTLAYCVDAYLKWRAARAGGLAQGTRVVSKQTTVTREGY